MTKKIPSHHQCQETWEREVDLDHKIKFSIFNPQLTETYRNSLVGDAFDRIDIEAFSKGSVLVDYYVYFKHFDEQVSWDS